MRQPLDPLVLGQRVDADEGRHDKFRGRVQTYELCDDGARDTGGVAPIAGDADGPHVIEILGHRNVVDGSIPGNHVAQARQEDRNGRLFALDDHLVS